MESCTWRTRRYITFISLPEDGVAAALTTGDIIAADDDDDIDDATDATDADDDDGSMAIATGTITLLGATNDTTAAAAVACWEVFVLVLTIDGASFGNVCDASIAAANDADNCAVLVSLLLGSFVDDEVTVFDITETDSVAAVVGVGVGTFSSAAAVPSTVFETRGGGGGIVSATGIPTVPLSNLVPGAVNVAITVVGLLDGAAASCDGVVCVISEALYHY